jgi:hypothetical protein
MSLMNLTRRLSTEPRAGLQGRATCSTQASSSLPYARLLGHLLCRLIRSELPREDKGSVAHLPSNRCHIIAIGAPTNAGASRFDLWRRKQAPPQAVKPRLHSLDCIVRIAVNSIIAWQCRRRRLYRKGRRRGQCVAAPSVPGLHTGSHDCFDHGRGPTRRVRQ